SGLPLNSMRSILVTTWTKGSGRVIAYLLLPICGCSRLKQCRFVKVFFPRSDAGTRAASQMTEISMSAGFVLAVFSYLTPEKTSAATPAIQHNPIQERLIRCSYNERVILV